MEEYLKKTQDLKHNQLKPRQKHPKGFESGVYYNPDTNSGYVVSRPRNKNKASFESLLKEWGWNPKDYELVGDLQVRTWDMNMGKGEKEQAWYFKANIRKKDPVQDKEMEKLISQIKKKKPLKPKSSKGQVFFYFASDWQLGKPDGKGVQGTIDRINESILLTIERIKELRKSGVEIGAIYIVFLGDLIEGTHGFYAGQEHTVVLDRLEQITLARRLMMKIITELSKHAGKIVVAGVCGNHGENRKAKSTVVTSKLDNDDTLLLMSCADIIAHSPYKHIKFVIPDGYHLTLDVKGTVMGFTHGHVGGNRGRNPEQKLMNMWSQQTFGFQPLGDATILVSGHYHHFRCRTDGSRTWFQTASLDSSDDFQASTGVKTANSVLTFTVDKHGWDNLKIIKLN